MSTVLPDEELPDFAPGDPDGKKTMEGVALLSDVEAEERKIRVRELAKELHKERRAEELAAGYKPASVDLDDFLGEEEPPPDWIIPGMLERQDRIIVTGRPGSGKSVLSRQVAVCAASGIHPFDLSMVGMRPVKTVFIDLENPETLTRRKLRELRTAAGRKYRAGMLTVVSRPDGMNLVGNDGAELRAELDIAKPDLVIVGPLYKMVATGDVIEEPVARELTATLDRLRIEYGFALWIEAHPPHSELDKSGIPKILRPYGASLFTRWPEFGYAIHYNPDSGVGELIPWRPDRQEGRHFPNLLRRGGKWPWTDPGAEVGTVWLRMADACEKHAVGNRGQMPSQRKLAEAMNVSPATVNQWIREHRERWDTLKMDMANRHGPQTDIAAGQAAIDDPEECSVDLEEAPSEGETP